MAAINAITSLKKHERTLLMSGLMLQAPPMFQKIARNPQTLENVDFFPVDNLQSMRYSFSC